MLTEATRLQDFPSLSGISYLNTAAESIPPRCVAQAMDTYWNDKLRGMNGRESHLAHVEACREISARMLGLDTSEVSFCSCSSEAYNLLASALQLRPIDEVVINDLDFPAGATPWLRAAEMPTLKMWKSEGGALQVDQLASLLSERTKLVQVSLISFYNGHRIFWRLFRDTVRRFAPNAIISVDVTQALGRIVLDCSDADIIISSTHKWTLGIHGGCVIGIPLGKASRLTTHAGGWFHLQNAFEADRFEKAVPKTGAASYSVGMPNFVALYALNASLRYLDNVGVANIAACADPLTAGVDEGLRNLGIEPLCPWQSRNPSGIVAFRHEDSAEIHAALEAENIHVMHHAGRIRIAVHGYNTADDIEKLNRVLGSVLH